LWSKLFRQEVMLWLKKKKIAMVIVGTLIKRSDDYFFIFVIFKKLYLKFLLAMTIHEMTILLVPLSNKTFLINIQDLIHSLNNKYFQDYVQIFKPYWKLVIWHVICILGAQEHKITSCGSISTTKFDVFQYYAKFHIF